MNILLQQWNGIGDFILTLPTFEALRKTFNKNDIHLEVPSPILPLAKQLSLANSTKLLEHYKKENIICDLGIIFTYSPTQDPPQKRIKKTFMITFGDFAGSHCHMSQFLFRKTFNYLRKSKTISRFPKYKPPRLVLPEKFITEGYKNITKKIGLKDIWSVIKIAIHPGAGFYHKCWPLKNYMEIIKWLSKIDLCRLFIIIGPHEQEKGERLRKTLTTYNKKRNIHWIRGQNLLQTAALLKNCDLYIGNDSGISHLAGALQIHTICIFGPMGPGAWGPYGKNNIVLFKSNDEIKCNRCDYLKMPHCKDKRCLNMITIDEVKQAIGYQLNKLIQNMTRRLKVL